MTQTKLRILMLVLLLVGFGAGFVLRPILVPPPQTVAVAGPSPTEAATNEARGTQYFEAHIDEARQVVAACREGTMRGDECANAETAVVTVESRERFRRFRGER